jgi:lipoprotein NlpD
VPLDFEELPVSRSLAVLLLAVLMLILAGCGGRTPAPYSERGAGMREPELEFRAVMAGDTLYSIAWESGRDYRDLAAWNRIPPPYLIKPGQQLRLFPPRGADQRSPSADGLAADEYHDVVRGETLYGIARNAGVSVRALAAWNGIAPPYVIKPGQRLRITPPDGAGKVAQKSKSKQSAPSQRAVPAPKFGSWVWPAEGRTLEKYSESNGNKGIDIAGSRGQIVVAAASGFVVYQGSGLRGYGQLIIIKHDSDFLSAYAHCDKIYVREGQEIKRGQKVAEMGSSGTDRVKLHFEIRFRGVPVDPLRYLPKR